MYSTTMGTLNNVRAIFNPVQGRGTGSCMTFSLAKEASCHVKKLPFLFVLKSHYHFPSSLNVYSEIEFKGDSLMQCHPLASAMMLLMGSYHDPVLKCNHPYLAVVSTHPVHTTRSRLL